MSVKKFSAAARPVPGQYLARDRITIAYRLCVPTAARSLVVLLHGLGADGSVYEWFGLTLAQQGHLVCLPDLRGHGQSGGTQGDVRYIGQHTDDLLGLLEHLRALYPLLPIFLGGHSAGNSLLLQLLDKRPELVSGVFLLAPVLNGHTYYSRRQDASERLAYRLSHLVAAPDWTKPEPDGPMAVDVELHPFNCLLAGWFPNLLGGLRVLTSRRSVSAAEAVSSAQYFSYRHFASLRCLNLESKLANIQVPVLVAIGENDQFTFPNAVLSLFRWGLPPQTQRQLMHIKRCGHFNIMTIAAILVGRWLEDLAPMKSAA